MDWSIKRTAKKLNVSARTLRYYESRGMLTPRRIGAIRYYSEAQRTRIMQILHWKQLGFSLTAIKDLLTQSEVVSESPLDLSQISQQIDYLNRKKSEIDEALQYLSDLQGQAEYEGTSLLSKAALVDEPLDARPNRIIANLHRAEGFTRKRA
jgi:DNA-binding transcriptional MerR regulator